MIICVDVFVFVFFFFHFVLFQIEIGFWLKKKYFVMKIVSLDRMHTFISCSLPFFKWPTNSSTHGPVSRKMFSLQIVFSFSYVQYNMIGTENTQRIHIFVVLMLYLHIVTHASDKFNLFTSNRVQCQCNATRERAVFCWFSSFLLSFVGKAIVQLRE